MVDRFDGALGGHAVFKAESPRPRRAAGCDGYRRRQRDDEQQGEQGDGANDGGRAMVEQTAAEPGRPPCEWRKNLVVNGTAETEALRGFNFTPACAKVPMLIATKIVSKLTAEQLRLICRTARDVPLGGSGRQTDRVQSHPEYDEGKWKE